MEKFQNKYRVSSFRLKNWNYCSEGDYFITICTQNMEHYFGKIENAKMQLSPVGVIADILWYQIPYHSKNVELGAFVVMPNHIHGILTIVKNNNKNCLDNPNNICNCNADVDALHAMHLPTQPTIPLSSALPISSMSYSKKNERMAKISPKKNSISSIIRSYKSAVTKHANRLGFDFQWQTRFYDHIIRNDKSFQNISKYIHNNPANWQNDNFLK
jgi:REP element-mobilizing transposase RayT